MEKVNQNISNSIRAAFSLPTNRYVLPAVHLAMVLLLEMFLYFYYHASIYLALLSPVLALFYVFAVRLVAGTQVGYATVRRVSATHAFFLMLILITAAIDALARAGLRAFLTASLALAGFMYIILRGEFLGRAQAAAFLALYFALLFMPLMLKLGVLLSLASVAPVLASYAATAAFLIVAGRYTEKKIGYKMLEASKRALEAWMIGYTPGLEMLFETNSTQVNVKTYALELNYGDQKDVIVVPPLHPGPFKGVGGYNLTELVHQEMKKLGYRNCIVLHSASNHDMNPASRSEALRYARSLRESAAMSPLDDACLLAQEGEFFYHYGICSESFKLIIADPKVTMDDYPQGYILKVLSAGQDVMIVDSHNKLSTTSPQVNYDEPLELALRCSGGCKEKMFADVKRLSFTSEEVGEAGIHAVYISNGTTDLRLLVVDSNNAVPEAYEAVKGCGYVLVTTDTHVSATSKNKKGYWAFGEIADIKALCRELQSITFEPHEVRLSMLKWTHKVKVVQNGMALIREAMSGSLKYFKYYLATTAIIYLAAFVV